MFLKDSTPIESEWAYIQAFHKNNCIVAEIMDSIDWYTQERWRGAAWPLRIYAEDWDAVY